MNIWTNMKVIYRTIKLYKLLYQNIVLHIFEEKHQIIKKCKNYLSEVLHFLFFK